jgi:hypothetical protein
MAASGVTDRRLWIMGGGLLAVVLMVLGIFARRRRPRAQDARASQAPVVPAQSTAVSLRELQQACATHDARAAAQALLALARAQWPDDPPRGLTALALRLDEGAAAVTGLEHSLYGPGSASSWRGDRLMEIARRGLRPRRNAQPLHDDGLTVLYPSQS